jgi:hypothetical protein
MSMIFVSVKCLLGVRNMLLCCLDVVLVVILTSQRFINYFDYCWRGGFCVLLSEDLNEDWF